MGLAHSPKIATDGLVFAYDMSSTQKSWKGAPTTNLITNPRNLANDRNELASSGCSFTDFTTGGPTGGPFVRVTRVNASPPADWPWQISYPSIAIGTSFKFSCYARSINGSVSTIEFSNPDSEEVSFTLTPRWQRFSTTFTSGVQSNLQFMRINRSNPNDKTIGSIYDVADAQIEVQSILTPFVNGIRTNTQAIADLMGTNTITATSLTYAADNTFSFNGSSNYIDSGPVALTGTSTQSLTWACWVSSATANGDIINMVYPTAGWNMCPIYASGQIFNGKVWSSAALPADFSFTLNQYYYLVLTRNNTTNTNSFYVNGRLVSSQTGATYSSSGNANNHYFGRAGSQATNTHFNGKIPSGQIYTKALTEQEIQQNFNALRTRYGV